MNPVPNRAECGTCCCRSWGSRGGWAKRGADRSTLAHHRPGPARRAGRLAARAPGARPGNDPAGRKSRIPPGRKSAWLRRCPALAGAGQSGHEIGEPGGRPALAGRRAFREPNDPVLWQARLDWALAAGRLDRVRRRWLIWRSARTVPRRVARLAAWLAAQGRQANRANSARKAGRAEPGDEEAHRPACRAGIPGWEAGRRPPIPPAQVRA